MSVPPPDNQPPANSQPPGGFGVPPGNAPPGGVYYGAPTGAPPRSNSGGCWKAFGITCGVLVLLAILGSFALFNLYKREASRPGSLINTAFGVGTATTNGLQIYQAIERYHTAKGKYPSDLKSLYPDYLPDGKLLHSSLDPNPNPGHVSWTYTKPAANASGDTPILTLPYSIAIPGQTGPTARQPGKIVITLDGQVLSDSARRRRTF